MKYKHQPSYCYILARQTIKSGLRAFEPAVPTEGPHHCPRHQTIRGPRHSLWRPLLPIVRLSLEWRHPRDRGGPNCRTWSTLRWFPKPGFPKPVRGRREPDCWGFSVLEISEAQDTDKDSLLLLRQLLLSHISKMRYKGPGLPWCFLEHPEDPKLCSTSPSANRCSTIWQTQAVQAWCRAMGLTLIHFDECELGQAAVKSTVLATDLPLHHWQGLHCTHEKHERAPGMNSSDLSRYPPEMMQGLSTAIMQHIAMKGSEPPLEVRADSLQPTGGGPAPEVVDRPSTTPVSRLQALLDPTVMVRLGFKVRPLRDGGGKPSPGRSPPPLRKPAPSLVDLGKKTRHQCCGQGD